MKFVYLVRRDEEWHKGYQHSKGLGDRWQSRRLADTWDSLFAMKWIDFRIECDKIRQENEKDLKYDFTLSTYQIKSPQQLAGCVVVPCDDDDWLRDDIFDVLRSEYTGKHDSYRWNFVELSIIENGVSELRSFSYPTNIPYPAWQLTFNYQSNNYAVPNPQDIKVLDLHGRADRLFDTRNEKFLRMDLSVHNGHLASLSFMKRTETWYDGNLRTGLVDMLRRFKLHYPIKNTDTPPYFDRFIDRMMDLYSRVKVK